MIGKIVKGTSFSGCVNYVLKEDKSRLLKAVGVYGSPEEIAEQFELQTLLNDKVKNTVGHLSLIHIYSGVHDSLQLNCAIVLFTVIRPIIGAFPNLSRPLFFR